MKVLAVIQARLGSTRCPKKVIREIEGKPILAYVIERVQQAKLVDHIIVAMPGGDYEVIATAIGAQNYPQVGVHLYGGDENDVADRFVSTLRANPCDAFVRICADSPLIDPALIDMAVERFSSGVFHMRPKIIHNTSFPQGQQVEVVDTEMFLKYEPVMMGEHREHVTSWFYEDVVPGVWMFEPDKDFSDVRMVVDTEEDFENMKTLIGKMEKPHTEYHWYELMEMM